MMGNTTAFNSKNPFEGAGRPPSYDSTQYEGNLGGSLGKRVSFFTNAERRNLNELAVVNTPFVDPTTLQVSQFTGAFPNPRTRTEVSQRFDFQVTPNNTLTTRYQYWRNNEQGDVTPGGFSLPSTGYDSLILNTRFRRPTRRCSAPAQSMKRGFSTSIKNEIRIRSIRHRPLRFKALSRQVETTAE